MLDALFRLEQREFEFFFRRDNHGEASMSRDRVDVPFHFKPAITQKQLSRLEREMRGLAEIDLARRLVMNVLTKSSTELLQIARSLECKGAFEVWIEATAGYREFCSSSLFFTDEALSRLLKVKDVISNASGRVRN